MRALMLQDFGALAVEDVPAPTPGPGEVRLRTLMTGICGSDLHGYTGANGRRVPGQVMGHETVGIVESAGAGVDLPVGGLATVNPVVGCGDCVACREGIEPYCPAKRVIGVDPTRPAAFADLVVAPAANIVLLPDSVPQAHGALVEPLAVGYHAAVRGAVADGDPVLVIGGGPIGQAAALAARRLGAGRVIVSEPLPGRRALCHRLGFEVLDPADGPVHDQAVARIGGPAAVTLDAVGNSATIADALNSTALGGRVVLVGMAAPTVDLDAFAVSTGERALLGAFSYTAHEFAETAHWVGTGPSDLAALIEREVPLEEAPAAFAALTGDGADAGKVLVRFS